VVWLEDMSSKSLGTVVFQNRTEKLLGGSGLNKVNKIRQKPKQNAVQIQKGVS
jgi:hypothetical protein